MYILIGVLVVIGIIILFIVRDEGRVQKRNLYLVDKYENDGAYERAIYHYGILGWKGYRPEHCRGKIKKLYRMYGPFNFEGIHEEDHDERHPSCTDGAFEITVKFIRDTLSEEPFVNRSGE